MKRPVFPHALACGTLDLDVQIEIRSLKSSETTRI